MKPLQLVNQHPLRFYPAMLLLLSFLMIVINYHFYIDDYIDKPQLTHWHHLVYCFKEIKETKSFFFYTFFIADFFYAACMLVIIYKFITPNLSVSPNLKNNWFSFLANNKVIFYICLFTYGLDAVEGVLYMYLFNVLQEIDLLKYVSITKEVFYAFLFLLSIIVAYKKWIKPTKNFGLYIMASIISLLMSFLIIFLLTNMEQGKSLIIDLLNDPLMLALAFLFIYVLYMVFSHYPVYLFHALYLNRYGINNYGSWKMITNFFGFGVVMYNKMPGKSEMANEYEEADKVYSDFRKIIGSFIYFAFIYSLLFTYVSYRLKSINMNFLFFIAVCFTLGLVYMERWKNQNKLAYLKTQIIYASFIKTLAVMSAVIAVIFSLCHGWYVTTFWVTLFHLFCMVVIYTYRYKPYDADERAADRLLLQHDDKLLKWYDYYNNKLWPLSNYVTKLKFIWVMGYLSVIGFILSHTPFIAQHISPVLVLLWYVLILYGIIIMIIKYTLYAANKNFGSARFKNTGILLLKYTPLIVVLVLGFKKMYNKNSNELTFLNQVKYDKNESMNLDTFINTKLDTNSQRYYIASWGGGLRATYFNFLLLDKIDKQKEGKLFNQTVAVSGASGGMLGLGFHFMITKENKLEREFLMDEIGSHNFVTTDLAYLLGADRLPSLKNGRRDRSITGIHNYWRIIKKDNHISLDETPYEKYWKDAIDTLGYYPIIITNTTKTHGNYGIACSATPSDFKAVFGGATNILRPQKDLTLPFLEALSTTERFALFSSTASIQGLGHFLDAGYFENTGLLSLMNMRRYVNSIKKIKNKSNKDNLLIIANSKSNFILYKLQSIDTLQNIKIAVKGETDFAAIAKGLTSTDRLGQYLANYYDVSNKDTTMNVKTYALPYPLNYSDVVTQLGGEPDTAGIKIIRKFIKDNNHYLDILCNDYAIKYPKTKRRKTDKTWDFAYPTLSRLLSKSTVNYYKAIVGRHKDL